MKFTSRASDYALLLLIHLSKLKEGETTNIKKATTELKLSLRFLANIASKLSIARIILSHRGVGGGIRLAKPASQITIREVIEAVDGPVQTMFCQNTSEICNHEMMCQMKHFWNDTQHLLVERLVNTSIATLVNYGCPV
ncbi:MAG: hypothetical protein A3G32_07010 [Deltaproteobacteria bacterium RIFCSPLOWO2_12_FULL_40_28]|nr:MAG: hypothetical protein A3C45_07055 [Deltaproteobacteria bacterium RIFCSPHIGHO2_02_FULL_40_28]OGQ19294.1 MAG: hypothetical protein A3E27_04760 [Deltaproteobacteria bacterium RIFCSPHIGHO2_12_FULL_40_32]OGQ40482.1 MAG: hypothetical protein A3I69_00310 [Deltaproteobacteria bacterium RIFCSPLOWO2_02_FULL_40_36]OGQ53718.1 MAG: hypothetical protein A3G32_07010 [Deltaproteobacteria bacterium RIFCSPLOWO2_12_FULL_40_28]